MSTAPHPEDDYTIQVPMLHQMAGHDLSPGDWLPSEDGTLLASDGHAVLVLGSPMPIRLAPTKARY